jgi:hypothetical protein
LHFNETVERKSTINLLIEIERRIFVLKLITIHLAVQSVRMS